MAKQDALSIYLTDGVTKDKLLELYNGVIDSVQKRAISELVKNKQYSGDARSGSVEIKRFVNATVNAYGTARTAGAGTKLENNSVIINVDTDKEIVEEIQMKDIALYGVEGIIGRRQQNHVLRMVSDLDNAFFSTVESEGTEFTPTGTSITDQLEELIQQLETTENDYVDGVDREMLVITASPYAYGLLRNQLDTIYNTNLTTTGNEIDMFHKVRIYSNTRQTADLICMIDGAVAQLINSNMYQAERIPLSNSMAVSLFYSRGTKAIMPDLIFKIPSVA